VVVITGAGSGIGRALAMAAANRGATLAISDIDAVTLAETGRLIGRNTALQAAVIDVSDATAMSAYADEIVGHFGRVNMLINNAGVSLTGDFDTLSLEDMQWIVGVNWWGVVHGTRAFLPHLVASGEGYLVNISSLYGLISMPGQSLYNATKFAVRGFTESVREEILIAGHPVSVTCVHPGGIRTGIARNGRVGSATDHATTVRFFDQHLARLDPAAAAETILRGALAKRARVLIGADAHLLHHVARFSGSKYQDVVALASRRLRNSAS
jgi:short-subunit dehydrogenase